MRGYVRFAVAISGLPVAVGIVFASAVVERGGAAAAHPQAGAATIVVGPRANGTTVRLRVGDSLVVRLPGNPTTGYRWVVAQRPPALRLVASRYAPSLPTRLGRGGTYTFRFEAGVTGSGRLRLAYRRPWETGKPALRSFTLTIRAR